VFPRRLHPLQRRKLLKVTVFDSNRREMVPQRFLNTPPTHLFTDCYFRHGNEDSLGRNFYYTREVSPFACFLADDRKKQNTWSRQFKFTAPAVRDVSLYFIWHGTFARQVKLPSGFSTKLNELNVLRTGDTRRFQRARRRSPALLSSLRF